MYGFRIGAKTVSFPLMAPAPLMMPLPMALKSPPTPNHGFRVTPKSPSNPRSVRSLAGLIK